MPASKIFLTVKTDTKEEEEEIVREFLTRLQYIPKSVTPHEQPDFEIELIDMQIGVEVTKYYSDYTSKGSKIQQKLSEWKKFAENLKIKLSTVDSDFIYLYGSIHFHNDNGNYRDLLKDNYFSELVKFLKSVGLKRTEQKTLKISTAEFPLLSNYIDSIFLWDTYPEDIYLWWVSSLQSGQVKQNKSALKFIIDKKEKSSKKYKNDYYQKWLIIYAGGHGLHDLFTYTAQQTIRQGKILLQELTSSSTDSFIGISSNYFSHIYVWDKFTEIIFQVCPYYKKIFDSGQKSIWVNHLPIKE